MCVCVCVWKLQINVFSALISKDVVDDDIVDDDDDDVVVNDEDAESLEMVLRDRWFGLVQFGLIAYQLR